jgi:1-pyrroline-5-carboxylate dehydrogenase
MSRSYPFSWVEGGIAMNGIVVTPDPINEPVRTYAPGSPEKQTLKARLREMLSRQIEIPLIIGGEEVRTGSTAKVICPHDHGHVLASCHMAGVKEVDMAVTAARNAWQIWSETPWEARAAVFLKAAELLAGPWRDTVNAATMLNQSKSVHQSEIDAACETIDFWRFNPAFMRHIYTEQPSSSPGIWNYLDYRPLEGFVFAVTPFNFTSTGGNLATIPAMMGNVVLWKPASTALLAGYYLMKVLEAAGLPPGVINFLPGPAGQVGDPVLSSTDFAGVFFTGSNSSFNAIWGAMSRNLGRYRSYPRIVGETGGKDFVFAHASAEVDELATALVRGAFEYQGQKCSATSRAYIPRSLWAGVQDRMLAQIAEIRIGDPLDFRNFMNAVIDRPAYDSIMSYIAFAKSSAEAQFLCGGKGDRAKGFYIEPTVVLTTNPRFKLMSEEIFGPVLTIYVYDDAKLGETLDLCNSTSPYALTGSIFCRDRNQIVSISQRLRHAAGNVYINDKTTGAMVGQQPFGGGRGSGTNDKVGSMLSLMKWTSPRAVKENLTPPRHFSYPFMGEA